jgi:hypothetical protein
MRSIRDSTDAPGKPGGAAEATSLDAIDARTERIERIAAAMAACEKLGDCDLARRAGRALLAAAACAADALLADGGAALNAAPDKFGAFFDKAAAGYVQAIDGLAKRAALAEEAGNGFADGRPCVEDPLARSIEAWRAQ